VSAAAAAELSRRRGLSGYFSRPILVGCIDVNHSGVKSADNVYQTFENIHRSN